MIKIIRPLQHISSESPYSFMQENLNLNSLRTSIRNNLFFVVGCARSGTSLTHAILLSHPDLSLPPETFFFNNGHINFNLNRSLENPRRFEKVLNHYHQSNRFRQFDMDLDLFKKLALEGERSWPGLFDAFATAYSAAHGNLRFGEKSPGHSDHVFKMARWFPNAKFIFVLRDPRAVVSSQLKLFKRQNRAQPIALWKKAEEMWEKASTELGKDRVHLVYYEKLITNPETEIEKLTTFLDLPFHPSMLHHHKRSDKGFLDLQIKSQKNTLKPIFTDSLERWKSDLKPHDCAMIEFALSVPMAKHGYALNTKPTLTIKLKLTFSKLTFALMRLSRIIRGPLWKRKLFRSFENPKP